MDKRTNKRQRTTSETDIQLTLDLDGSGTSRIATGLGFFDHMLASFAKHGRFDLELTCHGDLHIDDHHTVEDCAIVLGEAFAEALGDRRGIERFGDAHIAMDETLVRGVVDLCGRPFAKINLGIRREKLGDVACENLTHFFQSFAVASRNAVHIDVLEGANDHHRAEGAFKALAVALRRALVRSAGTAVPSTKGILS